MLFGLEFYHKQNSKSENNVNSFLTGDLDVEFISIWFCLSSSHLKYFKEASFTVLREKKNLLRSLESSPSILLPETSLLP